MRASRCHCLLVLLPVLATSGCAASGEGHTSSPWEWGFSVRAAPASPVGEQGMTAHPMASYTRLSFEDGTNQLFAIGVQIRYPLQGFWIGGEAAFGRLRTSFDSDVAPSYTTSGRSLTGLAGLPVGQSEWNVNLIAGVGIAYYGGTSKNLRLGVEVQPPFINIGR